MQNWFSRIALASVLFCAVGCGTQDVPQAHKGREFSRTGLWKLYSGGKGFTGPILGPGTHYTGLYNDVRMVDCTQITVKEPMTSLTKDGVQFAMDIYIRFSAACDDAKTIEWMLDNLTPDPRQKVGPTSANTPASPHTNPALTISAEQLYVTYLRSAVGEAVRETISPYIANDVNNKREEILGVIRKRFFELLAKQTRQIVSVQDVTLSHLDFPDELDKANAERAVQAVLKDKAIAEREKVTAEIETMELRKKLAEAEADLEAVKIDRIAAAYNRNPHYMQLQLYKEAGEKGNMIIAAPSPNLMLPAPGQKIVAQPAK